MQQETELPPGIGPHDGRELELMLAGEKPLALFMEAAGEDGMIPEDAFAPYVESGLIVKRDCHYHHAVQGVSLRVVFYAPTEESRRMDEAEEIIRPVFIGEKKPADDDDIRLGQLLGYSEDDVAAFVAWQMQTPAA